MKRPLEKDLLSNTKVFPSHGRVIRTTGTKSLSLYGLMPNINFLTNYNWHYQMLLQCFQFSSVTDWLASRISLHDWNDPGAGVSGGLDPKPKIYRSKSKINNGNGTESSPVRSVIIRVINKIGRPRRESLISNPEYDYRPNWTTWSPITN